MNAGPTVVIAEPFADRGQSELRAHGLEVVSCVGVPRAALLQALASADALIVRSETRVDRELLSQAPRVRVVGRAGVGVDEIDLDAATEAGILVLNTPAANTIAAAEHTFALMLGLMRNIAPANAALRGGAWDRTRFVGRELHDKTLGIVGLGRIGSSIAMRARAFGMNVLAHDPYVTQARADALDVTMVDLGELLERSDIVSLHTPLTTSTRNMIGAAELQRMAPEAILINCARGGVVDEAALLDALDAQTIRAAAIDVFSTEPPEPDSVSARLQRHARVLSTPHLGGSTQEALERIAVDLARDVADALAGKPAAGAVNAPAPGGADEALLRDFVRVADALGRLAPQLFARAAAGAMMMRLSGALAATDSRPLRAAFLSAFLQNITERRVSIVNASAVAAQAGIALDVHVDPQAHVFSSLLTIKIGDRSASGTVLHSGPRITELDGFELDAVPQDVWLLTRHDDVPGMVGRVGTILGESGINISTMQVARKAERREALMVLAIDRKMPAAGLDALRRLRGIHRVDMAVL